MIRIGGAMEADNVTYKEMKDLFFQDSLFLLSLFLTLQLTGMFIVVMLMANKKICSLWVDRRARTEIPVKNNIVWRLQCAAFQVILPYLIIDWIRVIFVWNQVVWVWLTRILAVSLMPRNSWSKYWYKYHIKEEESAFYFQLQGFDNRRKRKQRKQRSKRKRWILQKFFLNLVGMPMHSAFDLEPVKQLNTL